MTLDNSEFRDTTYDRATLDETFIALAEAVRTLIYPSPMLIPATVGIYGCTQIPRVPAHRHSTFMRDLQLIPSEKRKEDRS